MHTTLREKQGCNVLNIQVVSSQTVLESKGKFTLYDLKVRNSVSGDEWNVHRRFSHFLTLQNFAAPSRLLENGICPKVVADRKIFIAKYFSELLNQPVEECLSDELCEFLRIPVDQRQEMLGDWSPADFMMLDRGKSTPPPSDENGLVEWLIGESKNPNRDNHVFTKHLVKLSDNRIDEVLSSLFTQVGGNSLVSALEGLALFHRIVSIETNLENACILRALPRLSVPDLSRFVLNPTACASRQLVFESIKQSGRKPNQFLLTHSALVQYMAWLKSDVSSYRQTAFRSENLEGLAGVFALGPNSPVAHSPTGERQTALSQACAEARDSVSLALMNMRGDFAIQGSRKAAGLEWKSVSVPSECCVAGDIELKFRFFKEGEYEVSLVWTLVAEHADMDQLVSLLWDGGCFYAREENVEVFDQGPLIRIKTSKCTLDDFRRSGGTVEVRIAKSICESACSENLVFAITRDPRTHSLLSGREDPLVRVIRNLHVAGCEVNKRDNEINAWARLSAESIFIIASDLLGEKGWLWTALERVSRSVHRNSP